MSKNRIPTRFGFDDEFKVGDKIRWRGHKGKVVEAMFRWPAYRWAVPVGFKGSMYITIVHSEELEKRT